MNSVVTLCDLLTCRTKEQKNEWSSQSRPEHPSVQDPVRLKETPELSPLGSDLSSQQKASIPPAIGSRLWPGPTVDQPSLSKGDRDTGFRASISKARTSSTPETSYMTIGVQADVVNRF